MIVDGERATARRYDYIVVGGGTSSFPLAATLMQGLPEGITFDSVV